ncbi:hypothetical protein PR048_020214, partial [Dryococelus australis]
MAKDISTKGKNIHAHEMKPPCQEKCRLQCHTKYTHDQSMYKRANYFAYYLTVNDRRVRVCKTFFLNTLSVREMYACTAWDKLDELGLDSQSRKILPRNKKLLLMYLNMKTLFRWAPIDFSNVPARRQNVNNFTIFDKASENAYCYLWNEVSGNKGEIIEIALFVYEYIKSTKCKNFIFHSDNCCGQNKNKFLATMYLFAIQTFQNVESIKQKYFVLWDTRGMLQILCILVSKKKKKKKKTKSTLKSGPVYVPPQCTGIVQCSKNTGSPYHVKAINFTEFHDFKTLSAEIGSSFTVDDSGDVVTRNHIRVLQ